MRIRRLLLVTTLSASCAHSETVEIVCQGSNYRSHSLLAGEIKLQDEVKTFSIDGDRFNGQGIVCPIQGLTQIVCALPQMEIPGEKGKSLRWDINLNRVTGQVEERTHTVYTVNRYLLEVPAAKPKMAGLTEVISSTIFKGECQKSAAPRF